MSVYIFHPLCAQVYALPQRHKSGNEFVSPAANWKGVFITCESSVCKLPDIHTYIYTYILEGKACSNIHTYLNTT